MEEIIFKILMSLTNEMLLVNTLSYKRFVHKNFSSFMNTNLYR